MTLFIMIHIFSWHLVIIVERKEKTTKLYNLVFSSLDIFSAAASLSPHWFKFAGLVSTVSTLLHTQHQSEKHLQTQHNSVSSVTVATHFT